ncbi:hypothetical protein [Altericista sp. CCNU0014]|uniref:hypothetical protein n=1 Tax=Altericista sp. CCNU0014 TaxID=3082949 RepID=UPI00384D5AA6
MKSSFFILTTVLSLGLAASASAQTVQFIFGIPSDNIRLSINAYDPIPLLDAYGYPYQGFYHYYSLPGITGKTNYNPFSYNLTAQAQLKNRFEFPEEGNFVF